MVTKVQSEQIIKRFMEIAFNTEGEISTAKDVEPGKQKKQDQARINVPNPVQRYRSRMSASDKQVLIAARVPCQHDRICQ